MISGGVLQSSFPSLCISTYPEIIYSSSSNFSSMPAKFLPRNLYLRSITLAARYSLLRTRGNANFFSFSTILPSSSYSDGFPGSNAWYKNFAYLSSILLILFSLTILSFVLFSTYRMFPSFRYRTFLSYSSSIVEPLGKRSF